MGQLDNTIVVFTTDNGAETFTFPDGGTTPFKGSKMNTWEGGMRAPASSAGRASSSPAPSRTTSSRRSTGCPRSSTSPAETRAMALNKRDHGRQPIRASSRPSSMASIRPTT